MKEHKIKIRNKILSIGYKTIVRPILFQIDPEKTHDRAIETGKRISKNKITKT